MKTLLQVVLSWNHIGPILFQETGCFVDCNAVQLSVARRPYFSAKKVNKWKVSLLFQYYFYDFKNILVYVYNVKSPDKISKPNMMQFILNIPP